MLSSLCPSLLLQPRPLLALAQAWLTMMLLAPLRWLFQRLVAAKVRTALGIRGGVVSGGGSLAAHLDDFFEVGFVFLVCLHGCCCLVCGRLDGC